MEPETVDIEVPIAIRSWSSMARLPGTGFSPFAHYFHGFVFPFWTALDFGGVVKVSVFAENQHKMGKN